MHDLSKHVKTDPADSKFGTETKFDIENMEIKENFEIDTYLINYAWFVKTGPMNSKFGLESKFDMENTKVKGKLDIDAYMSLIMHDLSKLVLWTRNLVWRLNSIRRTRE